MTLDQTLPALHGGTLDLRSDEPTLIVNVASKCGLTPQYEGLQQLYDRYSERGLRIVGVPCNQFGEQEPGTHEEIATFCSANYGVTFPLTAKLDVNGPNRHPLYEELTATPDAEGKAGDVQWNFEKFLVARDGTVTRFRPLVTPDDPALVAAIERAL
jgi:glutathione peroxidase